jgi:hypothetical protein
VLLLKVIDGNHVVIQRRAAAWRLEIGAGCPAITLFEGRAVGLKDAFSSFISIGASLVLPTSGQHCRIMSAEQ